MSEPGFIRRLAASTRWIAPLYIGLGVVLLPWIVYLEQTLPTHELAPHYRAAWVGFDIMLFGQLIRTGIYALSKRWQGRVRPHAAASAALLIMDAWFDVTTSVASDVPVSIIEAVLVELPLAALCWWLAMRPQSEVL